MKIVFLISRFLLGTIYAVFGFIGLFNLMPKQPPMEGNAGLFMTGIVASGYFMPVLKLTEMLGGLSLLSGRYMALSLVILAPISLHILLFHSVLMVDAFGTGMAILIALMQIVLMYSLKPKYESLLTSK